MNHFDVIIVGGGISGISAAVHLQQRCPGKTYAILEGRDAIGGTWDLFKYPGIRSDSDMHTLGFSFKPWTEAKSIADGPSILKYVNEAADEFGVRDHILLGHNLVSAGWASDTATWQLAIDKSDGSRVDLSSQFIFMCGGYYNYKTPHDPEFKDVDKFSGEVLHPQFWPEDMTYQGKKIVVIGSGATAMTIVPAMVEKGADVTMVQRSPTYVVSRPDKDRFANTLRKYLPEKLAYAVTRFKNITMQQLMYKKTRTDPEFAKKQILDLVKEALPNTDIDKHFTPSYYPWDQRLCLIPNGDLFDAINKGSAHVVTEEIDCFVPEGLKLVTGEVLPADAIVTATGLKMRVLSGVEFSVDGDLVDIAKTYSYKGMMFSGVPNMLQTFGYINASWTLRADLNSEYFCRLVQYMVEQGKAQVTPTLRAEDEGMITRPWIDDFSSGYMQRSMHLFPKQGEGSWRNTQDFTADKKMVRRAPIEDSALVFTNPEVKETGLPGLGLADNAARNAA